MNVLERDIEKPVVRYAKEKGCLTRKLNGMGFAGWPDRMIISPSGVILFIEFKRPGGELTPLQRAFHSVMRRFHLWVEFIDNVEHGKKLIDELLRRKK